MAYLAGMIWSVSMLSPNFQARPRTTLGSVMPCRNPRAPAVGCFRAANKPRGPRVAAFGSPSSDLRRHLLQHLARVADDASDGAGRRDGWVREIDLRLRVAHAAREVAVRGAEADLALAEHAHVAPKARTAGGRRPGRAGGEERPDQSFLLGLDRDLVRGRRDDQADARRDLVVLEHGGR